MGRRSATDHGPHQSANHHAKRDEQCPLRTKQRPRQHRPLPATKTCWPILDTPRLSKTPSLDNPWARWPARLRRSRRRRPIRFRAPTTPPATEICSMRSHVTQGQQGANLTQQNQLAFANQSKQDQLTALQGLSGLYGTNSGLLGRAIGVPGELLNTDASLAKAPMLWFVVSHFVGRRAR